MLDQVFLDNTFRRWIIALSIVAGAFVLCKIIQLLERRVLVKLVLRSKTRLDDVLLNALMQPLRLGIMLVAIWVAAGQLQLSENLRLGLGVAYQILTVLNVTWFFSKMVAGLFEEYGSSNRLSPLLQRTGVVGVWLIGSATALTNAGFDLRVLLGGLGIGGMAAALAAQDTIKNIFGGITVYADKPFRIGDIIRFDDIEGTVTDIGIRSTRMLTYEGRLVSIPNYKMIEASLVNISSEPSRRMLVTLGLTYDTTAPQMQEALDILKRIPHDIDEVENEASATFTEFGDFALQLTYIYYVRKGIDHREASSKVNFAILQRFGTAGLSFAFPSQTVYLSKQN
jgi:MscS family membrane protein